VAFTLYDTYGFPLDLTQDALKPRGIGVDTATFDRAMERQREKARAAWSGSGEAATETVWYGLREKVGASEFLGYETETAEGVVLATLKNGAEVGEIAAGETGLVILNQTPFYGESGGQVGDTGIMKGEGVRVRVTGTEKKLGDLFVHHVLVEHGSLKPGLSLELVVDHERRSAVRANHSATHLLHEALRQVLGDHVAQKGSLVAPDRLRFDFSHPKPIEDGDLETIESIANKALLQNEPVITRLMAVDEAIESGARALFGEKYGDEVRVVSMGKGDGNKAFSIELCGGTHVNRTGDIGVITIVSEGAVAAGVRRLEAMTGEAARRHLAQESRKLREIAGLLKTPVDEAPERLAALIEDRRKLERDLQDARRKLAMGGGTSEGDPVREIAGVKLMARAVSGVEMRDLKSLADEGKKRLGSGVVAIVGIAEDGKAGIVVGVTDDLTSKIDAVTLVKAGAEKLGGKGGGGRRDMAQAGGPDGAQAEAALAAVEAALAAA
jgi:alanyl-tRNA synthetase